MDNSQPSHTDSWHTLRATPAGLAYALSKGNWYPADHLLYLSFKLVEFTQAVRERKNPRLLIEMPPRHGKSELASHWLPVWLFHHFPEWRVILASYAADFASLWGRKVRDSLVENQQLLGVKLKSDTMRADDFTLYMGGGLKTAGIRGPLTGRGGQVLIIDDPVKNQEEALSETIRERNDEWYRSVFYTRREPGAGIIIINTRWHEDDLTGRRLKDEEDGGEKWVRVTLPAIAGENDPMGRRAGEALWPARFDEKDMESIERTVGAYVWAALYQQRPTPQGGGLFSEDDFIIVPPHFVPEDLDYVRGWDLATTTKQTSHYTVGTKMGTKRNGKTYVANVVRGRWEWPDAEDEIVFTATGIRDGKKIGVGDGKKVPIVIEANQFQLGAIQLLRRRPEMRGYTIIARTVDTDIYERAMSFASLVSAHEVFVVKDHWTVDWIREHCTFPLAAYDDQVSSSSLTSDSIHNTVGWLSQMQDQMQKAREKKEAESIGAELVPLLSRNMN